jgi:hypothetical protein
MMDCDSFPGLSVRVCGLQYASNSSVLYQAYYGADSMSWLKQNNKTIKVPPTLKNWDIVTNRRLI